MNLELFGFFSDKFANSRQEGLGARSKMSSEKESMKELDGWVEQLMECKQLTENQVRNTENIHYCGGFMPSC